MKKQSRDFQKKSYKNPYFRLTKSKKTLKILRLPVIVLGVFCISYIILFSSVFSIDNIEIVGAKNSDALEIQKSIEKQMQSKRFFIFSQNNILFFNTKEAEQGIGGTFSLNEIGIRKKFLHSLEIHIQEKKASLVLLSNSRGYYIDEEGRVIAEINQQNIEKTNFQNYDILRHKYISEDIPILIHPSGKPIQAGDEVIQKKFLEKILNADNAINTKSTIEILNYELHLDDFSLHAKTADGWNIYFSMHEADDIQQQVEKLILLYDTQIDTTRTLDYIDLRFGDKVFFK